MYKFISAEVAPLFSKTLKIRFSQPSDLNDPFEFSPIIDFKGTAEEVQDIVDARLTKIFGTADGALAFMEKQQSSDPNYPKLIVLIPVFRKMIAADSALERQFMAEMERHKADVLDSTRMAVVWEAKWEKFQKTLGQAFGILSLTEDPTHPLMWRHYASRHFGIVVEFDQNHPWFNQKIDDSDDFRHLVKVTYVQEPHPRTWKQLKASEVLYTKSTEWAYEREWRVIRPLKDGAELSPGKICFEVPPEAVRSITFGCRTNPALEKQIRDLLQPIQIYAAFALGRRNLRPAGKLE